MTNASIHSHPASRSRYLTLTRCALTILAAALTAITPARSAAQVGKNLGLINPDLASESELTALPGLSPTAVRWILENRPFARMKVLDSYLRQSMDSAARINLYQRMYLPINLNNLDTTEIAMIPRAGRRMIREFNEYAPYAALAVWYREIDKYIDEPEIGRLQQYVFVPMNANSASDEQLNTIPGLKAEALNEIKRGRPWSTINALQTAIARQTGDKEAARITQYLVIRQ